MSNLNAEFFKQKVKAEEIRGLLIIQFAMPVGIIIFTGVLLFLYKTAEAPKEAPDLQLIKIMCLLHICLTLATYFGAAIMGKIHLGKKALASAFEKGGEEAVSVFTNKFRAMRIVQLALMEGAALFGLVVCLIANFSGALQQYPMLWGNTATAIIFVLFAFATMPNVNKLASAFQHKVEMWSFGG